jgi:hypothetical protein
MKNIIFKCYEIFGKGLPYFPSKSDIGSEVNYISKSDLTNMQIFSDLAGSGFISQDRASELASWF